LSLFFPFAKNLVFFFFLFFSSNLLVFMPDVAAEPGPNVPAPRRRGNPLLGVKTPGFATFAASADRFFTPDEVALHDSPASCWLSALGRVYVCMHFF
jgi:hypothetical protein